VSTTRGEDFIWIDVLKKVAWQLETKQELTADVLDDGSGSLKLELTERTYRNGSSNPGPRIFVDLSREDARALGEFLLEVTK